MKQVVLDWKQGLSFNGSAPSGFSVELDAEVEVGGNQGGFSPLELLALGLGGCTGMDVISILQKKRQAVTAFEVRVNTQRAAEHPKVWNQVLVEYIVAGKNIDPKAVERAIQLSAEKYCPAQNMLNKAVRIDTRYEIREG